MGYLMEFSLIDKMQFLVFDLCVCVCVCCARLVCLFLKRGADYNKKDISQKDPISIAVESANADIVTL